MVAAVVVDTTVDLGLVEQVVAVMDLVQVTREDLV